jgi:hypothetical protein
VGQGVDVDFDLRGRKWADPKGGVKYFTTLQAWRLGPASGGGEGGADEAAPPDVDTEDYGADKGGDMPF